MQFPEQKYLLQAFIAPRWIGERPAWFRVYFAAGEVLPTWWNPTTHVFTEFTAQEREDPVFQPLWELGSQIAAVCKLVWFSTEIAITEGAFVVVDYVNDQIDLRVQSKCVDGVPDAIIKNIAQNLVCLAGKFD